MLFMEPVFIARKHAPVFLIPFIGSQLSELRFETVPFESRGHVISAVRMEANNEPTFESNPLDNGLIN
jgi:hypothetical protein